MPPSTQDFFKNVLPTSSALQSSVFTIDPFIMNKYFTSLVLSFFVFCCLTACEDKADDALSETTIPEKFTLRVLGFEGDQSNIREFEVEESPANGELDLIKLRSSVNENRLYIDFRVPARISNSGKEERLRVQLVHNDKAEPIWTFTDVYNTVYYQNLPYVEHFAIATYEIGEYGDEDYQFFTSVNSLDPGRISITSFENGRLKGELGGDIGESLNMINDNNTAAIHLAGTFNARLTDDELDE